MFVATLWFCFVTSTLCTKIHDLIPQKPNFKTQFVGDLAHKHQKFQIVFHVDKNSSDDINDYLQTSNKNSVLVYSHSFKRIAQNSAHFVVLSDPTSFKKSLQSVGAKDVIIFLIYSKFKGFNNEFLRTLERVERALVVSIAKMLEIYSVCFYCRQRHQLLVRSNNTDMPRLTLPMRSKKYHDYEMKIGYLEYYPYVFCLKTVNETCHELSGVEIEAVKLLSQRMNFTYKLIKHDGDSTTLFQNVSFQIFDFAIGGLTVTSKRYKIVQCSYPLSIEDVVALYIYHEPFSSNLFAMFLPFPPLMWVGIFLILLGTSFFLFLVLKFSNERVVSLKTILQKFMKIVVEQPVKNFRKTRVVMIIVSSWFIFAFFITAAYKSRLYSVLVQPPKQYIPTLGKLLDEGYSIVATFGDVHMESFSSKQYLELIRTGRLIQTQNLCDSIEYFSQHRSVIIKTSTLIFLHSQYVCDETRRLSSVTKPMGITPLGKALYTFPFGLESPLFQVLDKNLKTMMKTGLTEIWRKKILYSKKTHYYVPGQTKTHRRSINSNIYFMVYIAGIFVSCFVFLCELFLKKKIYKWQY